MLLLATCAPGLAPILEREVRALGWTPLERTAGGVFFEGALADLYRANLFLRTASRVQRVLARVDAETDADVENALAAIDWRALLRPERGVEVEIIDAAADLGGIAERAAMLRRRVAALLGSEAALREDDEHGIRVVLHRHRGRLSIGLDTSGKALGKRGYRGTSTHAAPLQSTLAAALLLHMEYSGDEPFHDPTCGSGTIAIEAAMIAVGKPPLMHRKKGEFAFEWLRDFDNAAWRAVQESARRSRRAEPAHPVLGSDADAARIEEAIASAGRARVGHQMRLFPARFEDLVPESERGLLVANLPYGERLGNPREIASLYRGIGRTIRERFGGWRIGLLVPDAPVAGELGLEREGALRVRNGAIDCVFLASP